MTKPSWKTAPKPWSIAFMDDEGVLWIEDANRESVIGFAIGYDYEFDRAVWDDLLAILNAATP